ncbi:Copper amine oxidase N-terminal domain-containing protein [Desulforamulus putei DSM 12395]|uniref:Copper amine oxidase N-terminal domain-containing protein n=1 Tax=Desulforamulus putei DSM 12395 TaxID=1121429 RepID=A0A1M5AQS1_9FIRM|nr:copper amine oxidase N-terminal domain-containing protein [Desulforamulus putei]SHF32608.1 Copper amine oxidase N-terminal domain-containing protein [Desulforamulus putei DSM 12395]
MKKLISIILACFLVLSVTVTAIAAPTYNAVFYLNLNKYMVNNRQFTMDATPFIENNRTFVPIRYLAYACGVKDEDIKWDNTLETVTMKLGDTILQMQVGIDQSIQGDLVVDLDAAPIMKNGRTYLPARWIAEAFGYEVRWDEQKKAILIGAPGL